MAGLEFVVEDRLKFASEKLSVYQNSIECVSNLCFVTRSELDRKVISQFVTMDYSKSSRTINFNMTLVEVIWSDFLFRGLNQIKNSECWKLFLKRWHIESFYEFTNKNREGYLNLLFWTGPRTSRNSSISASVMPGIWLRR